MRIKHYGFVQDSKNVSVLVSSSFQESEYAWDYARLEDALATLSSEEETWTQHVELKLSRFIIDAVEKAKKACEDDNGKQDRGNSFKVSPSACQAYMKMAAF